MDRCIYIYHLPKEMEIGISLINDSHVGNKSKVLFWRGDDGVWIKTLEQVKLLIVDAHTPVLHHMRPSTIGISSSFLDLQGKETYFIRTRTFIKTQPRMAMNQCLLCCADLLLFLS